MSEIEELLTRGVANIIPGKNILAGKLQNNKKLNVYLGIDPTSTKIHLGHAVVLRKLNQFAHMGHNVTFLIGDFTALIGDTSDKEAERQALTIEEIKQNFKTYKTQAEKILDFSKVKIKYNSGWLKKLTFEDILKLSQHFSVGDFIGRELIKKRLTQNKRVGLSEFLYPVMQGYDSYMLNTDLQIGGTDQTFNMQAGRTLIKDLKNKESFVLTTPILEGADGRKMSKSWGNAIWLDDIPSDMYAKVMAINDELIISYFNLATELPLKAVNQMEHDLKTGQHPMHIKHLLAWQIVSELHDKKAAKEAQDSFEKIVQNKKIPTDIRTVSYASGASISSIALNENLVSSTSEWKRLIEQNGVRVNSEITRNVKLDLPNEEVLLQIGKRKAIRVKPKK